MLHRPLDLIARYGSEEFAVILPDVGEAQARQLAEPRAVPGQARWT